MYEGFDKVKELFSNVVTNIASSFYDKYIEANVEQKVKNGMKSVIIRRQVRKCCEWCANLAGIYEYGDEPDEVYQRHDNCKCLVTFYSSKDKTYKDVWSKQEYASQKLARQDRLLEIGKEDKFNKSIEKAKRQAISEGNNYYDALESYKLIAGKGEAVPVDYFEHPDGRIIKGLKFKNKKWEEPIGNVLANELGTKVELLPEWGKDNGIKSPDYKMFGKKYELKSPSGGSDRTIKNRIVDGLEQTDYIVLNLSEIGMPLDRAIENARKCLKNPDTKKMQELIIVKDKKILHFWKRI